ncbi:MAG: type II secretion system F family protein [Planctomycetes bacterium]|jgi:type IV pilus assembly protein PilC|nr:type II secretion system F family protein [Planctomycetota bacterium]
MRFRSTILDDDGSTTTTVLEASDEQALHDRLHREGRALLRVRALDAADADEPDDLPLAPRRLLLLTQALHEALDAGVPLLGTFEAIVEQEDHAATADMLAGIGERIAAGQMLSDALAQCPRAFPPLYIALIRAGEQSGSLPEVLQSIAGFLEWRIEISATIKQAMVYPLVVAAAGYAMVLFMTAFVIPRLGSVLEKMGGDLPRASLMLIDVSGFVAAHVWLILLGSIAAAIGAFVLLRTPTVQGLALAAMARLPVVRQVVSTMALAQFCRTFSVLLQAGLTMTSALELGGAAVALPRVRDGLDGARERILGGARLGEALQEQEVLPPVALSMVMVGEEAGRLPITFERLSRLYDREVKAAVKRALGLLEPVVTVLLGVVVGGVAVLVVTTIYSAMKGIGR